MKKEGYLWVVFCPLRKDGGYEIENTKTGEITYAIKSQYQNIAGACVKFETGKEYEPYGVILTESNDMPLVEQLPAYIIPLVTEQPLNSSLDDFRILPLGMTVPDIKNTSFTVIAAEEIETLDVFPFIHQRITVEVKAQ
jgi:hypothetical protein